MCLYIPNAYIHNALCICIYSMRIFRNTMHIHIYIYIYGCVYYIWQIFNIFDRYSIYLTDIHHIWQIFIIFGRYSLYLTDIHYIRQIFIIFDRYFIDKYLLVLVCSLVCLLAWFTACLLAFVAGLLARLPVKSWLMMIPSSHNLYRRSWTIQISCASGTSSRNQFTQPVRPHSASWPKTIR